MNLSQKLTIMPITRVNQKLVGTVYKSEQ